MQVSFSSLFFLFLKLFFHFACNLMPFTLGFSHSFLGINAMQCKMRSNKLHLKELWVVDGSNMYWTFILETGVCIPCEIQNWSWLLWMLIFKYCNVWSLSNISNSNICYFCCMYDVMYVRYIAQQLVKIHILPPFFLSLNDQDDLLQAQDTANQCQKHSTTERPSPVLSSIAYIRSKKLHWCTLQRRWQTSN